MQTLAASIVLRTAETQTNYSGVTGYRHSECSKIAKEHREKLAKDLSMEMQQTKERNYKNQNMLRSPQQPPATWQPAIGPLLEKLQELAKACKDCKKNVEDSRLDTFGLGLSGNDLRHVAMLPEWYWGLKLAH